MKKPPSHSYVPDMRELLFAALLSTVPFSAAADTIDWRNCQSHSAAETAEYRAWLTQHFDDQSEADALAASFQKGDAHWSGQPCDTLGPAPGAQDEYRQLPNGVIIKVH